MLQRVIQRTITPRGAAAIAALVLAPSLAGGVGLDDYVHRLQARGFGFMGPARPLDMFRFMDGVPAHLADLRARGLVPWFTPDSLRIAFFRPLAALTHWVDYGLLDLPPWLMHAESVSWYALLVFSTAHLYARVLGAAAPAGGAAHAPGVAGLAALLYAFDPGHGLPAGWLANRNAVMAAAFGVLSLLAHDRWRREGWRRGAALAPACLALSLASAELGVGTLAYLAAYAVTVEPPGWAGRARSFTPALLVAVAWQIAYRAGNYGVTGSGFYTDPVTAPGAFARHLPVHVAILSLGQLLVFPIEIAQRATITAAVATAGALALAVFTWTAWPLVRRDVGVRFLALGAALAIVPVTTVIPSTRVLMLVGVGAMGVLAAVVGRVVAGAETRLLARVFARTAGGLHVALAPLLLVAVSLSMVVLMHFLDASGAGLPSARELAGKTVALVNTPSALGAAYRFGVPREIPPETPAAVRFMAVGLGECVVTRLDARTLDVQVEQGLLNDPLVQLYRDTPVRDGDRVRLPDMEVEVHDDAGPNRPARAARFRFDDALESPGRVWIAWNDGRFVRFTPPAIGETVRLRN